MKEVSKILETLSDIKDTVPKWIEKSYHIIKEFCPHRVFYKHSELIGDIYKCKAMVQYGCCCSYKFCPYFLFKKEYLKREGLIK